MEDNIQNKLYLLKINLVFPKQSFNLSGLYISGKEQYMYIYKWDFFLKGVFPAQINRRRQWQYTDVPSIHVYRIYKWLPRNSSWLQKLVFVPDQFTQFRYLFMTGSMWVLFLFKTLTTLYRHVENIGCTVPLAYSPLIYTGNAVSSYV